MNLDCMHVWSCVCLFVCLLVCLFVWLGMFGLPWKSECECCVVETVPKIEVYVWIYHHVNWSNWDLINSTGGISDPSREMRWHVVLGNHGKNLETFIYLDVGKFKNDGLMNLPHEIRTTVLLSLGLQTRGCQEFDRSSRMPCIRLLGGFGRKFSSFLGKPCV